MPALTFCEVGVLFGLIVGFSLLGILTYALLRDNG